MLVPGDNAYRFYRVAYRFAYRFFVEQVHVHVCMHQDRSQGGEPNFKKPSPCAFLRPPRGADGDAGQRAQDTNAAIAHQTQVCQPVTRRAWQQ